MATIYPRKSEMDVTYIVQAAADAAFRFAADGSLQLKDSALGQFSTIFLTNGVPQVGEPED